jgi:hypothetical protein
MTQQSVPGGWTVNVSVVGSADRFATVSVAQSGTGQITATGFAAIASYFSTYYGDASIPVSDPRLPSLQITTSQVVANVLPGDGATVQAELVTLLATAGNTVS